jgi:hypothetical protein
MEMSAINPTPEEQLAVVNRHIDFLLDRLAHGDREAMVSFDGALRDLRNSIDHRDELNRQIRGF